jgi:hypothetical protein
MEQAVITYNLCPLAQAGDLGMCTWVLTANGRIMRPSDAIAVHHQDRPHRGLPLGGGAMRLLKRFSHEAFIDIRPRLCGNKHN